MKKTKILCTIGPASSHMKVLRQMHKAGMDGVRINTAFGSFEEYRHAINTVHEVADIPVLVDIKGPEIRLRCKHEIKVEKDSTIWVGFKATDEVSFNRNIYSQLRVGNDILLNKGKVNARITARKNGSIRLRLDEECILKNGGGVNIPKRRINIPTLSQHDLELIRLMKNLQVDYIALSFTRNVQDILNLKKALKDSHIGIIAKIENLEGVQNAESILSHCDGIMVARGDLGIEIPSERIPIIQKDIINKCNRMGKISIVATEMLQSMVNNPEPTRAETSDVANAILDGTDVVMLSAESAIGKYPLEAVSTLTRIALEVEAHMPIKPLDEEIHEKIPLAICKAVATIINTIPLDKIVVATHSGYTAMLISNFRANKDIIVITDDHHIRRKLHLVYAVQPIQHGYFHNSERILEIARYCLKEGLVNKKDLVLFTAGVYTNKPTTNIVQLHRISELLEYRKKN